MLVVTIAVVLSQARASAVGPMLLATNAPARLLRGSVEIGQSDANEGYSQRVLFSKTSSVPSEAEIKARSRILVIDDRAFPYKGMFEADNYMIEKRSDVKKTADIDSLQYELILLDLQGVGKSLSSDQGLGVLKYLKERNPTQLVVAYSSADYPMESQQFFALADASLPKAADYFEFKAEVDRLLKLRYTLGYYMQVAYREMDPAALSHPGMERRLRRAIRTGNTSSLRLALSDRSENAVTVDRVLLVVQTAASVLAL